MAKEKMTICKHCGAEIAAGAKTCPKCGGKNKKPIYKRVWFWILVAVLVLGIGGAAGGSGGSDDSSTASSTEQSEAATEEKQEEPKIEYQDVSVETLFEELDNNAMNASDNYKGQYLSITGVLGTIDSNGSYFALESDNDNYMFQSVTCYIKNDEQLEKVKTLSKGDTITVKGKVTDVGEVLGYYLDIDSIE
ncbi:MAG: zinc-ribbon domain-containing protein [Clostridiales bacterium]|nr:zinc-ribbon domain-containing protein [Clostridiales bacterium]